jgi:hypothetical protein
LWAYPTSLFKRRLDCRAMFQENISVKSYRHLRRLPQALAEHRGEE